MKAQKPMFGKNRIGHDEWIITWVRRRLPEMAELLEKAALSQPENRRTVCFVVGQALDWAAKQLETHEPIAMKEEGHVQ